MLFKAELGRFSFFVKLRLEKPVDADRKKLGDSGEHRDIGIRAILLPFRNRLNAYFQAVRQCALSQPRVCAKLSDVFANTKCQVRTLRFYVFVIQGCRTFFTRQERGCCYTTPTYYCSLKVNGN